MPRVKRRLFTEDQIRAIAQALGHTDDGLTGAEITDLLHLSRVKDELPDGTKWKRIYYSLWNKQCEVGNRTNALEFIRLAVKPARYATQPERFEPLRHRLNKALAFAGLQALEDGQLTEAEQAHTRYLKPSSALHNLKVSAPGECRPVPPGELPQIAPCPSPAALIEQGCEPRTAPYATPRRKPMAWAQVCPRKPTGTRLRPPERGLSRD